METLTILGLDAGTASFGYSVVETRVQKKVLQYRIHETGVIPCPVRSINDVQAQVLAFVSWIKNTVKKHKIALLVGERFQPRGMSRSNTTELIGMMYGALLAHNLNLQLILPVTWKNRVNKQFDLSSVYYAKKNDTPYLGEPHELDATLQALYGAYLYYKMEPNYVGIDKDRLANRINGCSTTETTAKRLRSKEKQLQRLPVSSGRQKRVLSPKRKRSKRR